MGFASQPGPMPALLKCRQRSRQTGDRATRLRAGAAAWSHRRLNGREYVGARSLAQLKQIVQTVRHRSRAMAEITDHALSRGPIDAPVTIELVC